MPTEPPPSRFIFPDARTGAGPHGIVCLGGDFSPGTLLGAYRKGIFPWPISRDTVPWCSPDPRAHYPVRSPPPWPRSVQRALKKGFKITIDRAFTDVMEGCGDRDEGTWIIPGLAGGFRRLHDLGWAHSVEVWNPHTDTLVGGIYGLAVGGMFAGESMFHRETDASKVAFATLANRLHAAGFYLFDVQQMTPHLGSLGCLPIRRNDFLERLPEALAVPTQFPGEPLA